MVRQGVQLWARKKILLACSIVAAHKCYQCAEKLRMRDTYFYLSPATCQLTAVEVGRIGGVGAAHKFKTGGFFGFFFYVLYSTLLHLPPLRSTVSEDAVIESRTLATSALAVRHSIP